MIGDGYCNDETNNRHCNFDGGDCCNTCISTLFCSDCKCLTGNDGEEISYPLIGDGYCHDEINNFECNYDGGDCCVNVKTDYCSECNCHTNGTMNALCSSGFPPSTVGDGYCNDEINIEECLFDGLDCCDNLHHTIDTTLCTQCICHGRFIRAR